MNSCDAKQKAFAQRVYFDLKICEYHSCDEDDENYFDSRKWTKLNVHFDDINKWIFFVGKPSDDQPLTFILPISSDEELTVDDLFNLRIKLCASLPSDIQENIKSVLMAIIANDFTLGYFNFSFGLPSLSMSSNIIAQTEISNNPALSTFDNDFKNEIKTDMMNDEWPTNDTNTTWD